MPKGEEIVYPFRWILLLPLSIVFQTSTDSVRHSTQALIKQWWSQTGMETELRNIDGVGLSAMLIAITEGNFIVGFSGFYPKFDGPPMRLTNILLALPLLPLSLVIIMLFRDTLRAAFGPEMDIFFLIVSLIDILNWMPTARVVRAQILPVKEQEFVLAAVALGTRQSRILAGHVFPDVLNTIIVAATLGVARALLTESALSFLGLGFRSDFPTRSRLL
jgi:peptide/nickel transport system permease protein